MATTTDHETFVGTDGDREYLLTKWDTGDLQMAIRGHLGDTWGPPETVATLDTPTCSAGHAMTPESTITKRGGRQECRECNRIQCRRRREKLADEEGRTLPRADRIQAVANGRRVDLDAFWAHVNADGADDCWLWTGEQHKGYGHYAGRGGAHRAAYEICIGDIPEGLELDHLCNTPLCVNPLHLEPVTRAENARRRAERNTHCKRGHEFTPANTIVNKTKRKCRACHNLRRGDDGTRTLATRDDPHGTWSAPAELKTLSEVPC